MSAIVCGIDFSACSLWALRAAAALGARLGSDVIVVHVVNALAIDGALRDATFARAKVRIEETVHAVGCARPLQTHLSWGDPVTELLSFAKARHASLLVVGAAGHEGGSLYRPAATSERLADQSDVPVLVVREGAPFEAWARGECLRALVALDETLSSASALRWAEKLRRVAPIDVVLGHIYYADLARAEYGLEQSGSPEQRIEALVERDLRLRAPTLEGTGEVSYRASLGVGRAGDHLVELAEAEKCGLLVMGSHHRRGLSRKASAGAAALHASPMSVVVVPPDGADAHPSLKPRRHHVLAVTDFSACGNAAIPWAYALVTAGGLVTLAHVSGEEAPSPQVGIELAAKLRALQADEPHAVTRIELLHGRNPAKAIAAAAARAGADLIVISSQGNTGLTRAALGAVAEELIRNGTRPVFVVRAVD